MTSYSGLIWKKTFKKQDFYCFLEKKALNQGIKGTKSWPLIQKTYPKRIWLVKNEKGIYQGKTCFSKVISINESAL